MTNFETGNLIKIIKNVHSTMSITKNWYSICKGKIGIVVQNDKNMWLVVFCDGKLRILQQQECLKLR